MAGLALALADPGALPAAELPVSLRWSSPDLRSWTALSPVSTRLGRAQVLLPPPGLVVSFDRLP